MLFSYPILATTELGFEVSSSELGNWIRGHKELRCRRVTAIVEPFGADEASAEERVGSIFKRGSTAKPPVDLW